MPKFRMFGKNLFAKLAGRSAVLGASVDAIVESLEVRQLLSVPNGPFGATATATGAGINVKWYDNSSDETGFKIERRSAGGAYQTLGNLAANTTTFSDTGVSTGGQYQYRIRAFNAGGDSGVIETNNVTSTSGGGFTGGTAGSNATTVPNGPYGLTASATSANSIKVSWNSNSNNEAGFTILRKTWSGNYAVIATVGAGVTTWTDTSVAGSTQYGYLVKAFNNIGDSGYSGEALATTPAGGGTVTPPPTGNATTVPNGPWGLAATVASATSVNLKWSAVVGNETGFKIERKTWSGAYSVIGTVGAGSTSWTDTSAAGSTQYTYRVKAYNNVGDSGYSGESVATTPAGGGTTTPPPVTGNATTVPNGPWGLTSTATSATSVNLKWSALAGNEAGFKIERKTWSGAYSVIGTVGAGSTSWTDTSAAGSTQYTYRVKAYNNVGDSGYSGESVATTPAGGGTTTPPPVTGNATTVPNGPWGLSASPAGNNVNLSWTDNATNESGFTIERKPVNGSYAVIGTTGAGVMNWTDTTASAGNTYVYRVKAFNNVGSSAYSNEAGVTSAGTGTGGGGGGGVTTGAWNPAETTGYFTIGVYRQPTTSFATWKARGINTVIDFYDRQDWMEIWIAAAHQYGFMEIRNPRANIALDKTDANLLAYEHDDEPDVNNIPLWKLQQEYAQWKAGNPNVPILVNVAGATVIGQADLTTDQDYKNIFATADWISNDVYPVGAWGQPTWIDKTQSNGNPWGITDKLSEAVAVDKIRQLTGGKRQFAYVGTTWQRMVSIISGTSRQPTPAEVRGQIWSDVIHGAKGVIYFPQAFNPEQTDATPPDVAAEITSVDAKLTAFAKVLNNLPDSQSNYLDLGGGLEGTYRDYGGHRYWFVLNLSHSSTYQKFNLPGLGSGAVEVAGENRSLTASGGAITDSFGQYDMHVYRV